MQALGKLPPLAVNSEAMRYILDHVMGIPRNAFSHKENKNQVGSFLYGKFGLLGLVTHMQTIDMTKLSKAFDEQVCMYAIKKRF